MAPNQEAKSFTVPVGTRLSQGVELEFLVAYLFTSDVDPDEQNQSSLAPILRIEADDDADPDAIDEVVEEHIRTTLRNHGLRVRDHSRAKEDGPSYLIDLDEWDVGTDLTVRRGIEESELSRMKLGEYQWLGVELRSPARWDRPDAYDEIQFVVNLLKAKYRVRVNPSCGLHVHVGNGSRYFDARTLKRVGAFFFAADPMLSRLHAPWRRAGLNFSNSIRYGSQLACTRGMKAADADKLVMVEASAIEMEDLEGFALETMPVVPWSDRSREEVDFGGREKWKQYADARVRDGPYLTLSEDPSLSISSETSGDSITTQSGSPSPATPSDSDGGGAYYRRFQKLMGTPRFQKLCLEELGHRNTESLEHEESYALLFLDQCEELFGSRPVDELSDPEFYEVVLACAPYLEVTRSGWDWDHGTSMFTMRESQFLKLFHPRPIGCTPWENVIANMDRVGQLRRSKAEEEASQDLEHNTNDAAAPEGAVSSKDDAEDGPDRITKRLYDRLDELMEQPTFPLEFVDKLLEVTPSEGLAASGGQGMSSTVSSAQITNPESSKSGDAFTNTEIIPSSTVSSPAQMDNSGNLTDSSSDSNISEERQRQPARPFSSSPYTSDSSPDHTDRGRGFKPPAFMKRRQRLAPQPTGSPPGTSDSSDDSTPPASENSSLFATVASWVETGEKAAGSGGDDDDDDDDDDNAHVNNYPKLRPHDPSRLPESYIRHISSEANLGPDHWQRISWLPRPGGLGTPDPATMHPAEAIIGTRAGAGPGGICECGGHAVTDTRAGLATILGVGSGAAVAAALDSPHYGARLNYNLTHYAVDVLSSERHGCGAKRTLEFREAAGSLDAELVVTLTRVAAGVVRFCRDAGVDRFLEVLERVVREEERQRRVKDGDEEDEDREDGGVYDVCDLLEDMGLFAEAAVIRRREAVFGPPR
ncbi:hypothetical protein SAMD00023353_0202740 [Rosellinia necatrix]|uniref:Amidoligase enzyme n=1 Tax=Rosellinia necatrix TaxID=77044 RepID=A0A1S7UJD4_ROSNE|nr:hypothetical protein SAMD00023353_0202740 [Rosellinia necatrix]